LRYWDASALIALYVDQARSTEVLTLARDGTSIATWTLTEIEIRSALARLEREKALTPSALNQARDEATQHWTTLDVIAAIDPVKLRARRLVNIHSLRAADAVQLAAAMTAVQDSSAGQAFVTLDVRLSAAAAREGFVVLPGLGTCPGAGSLREVLHRRPGTTPPRPGWTALDIFGTMMSMTCIHSRPGGISMIVSLPNLIKTFAVLVLASLAMAACASPPASTAQSPTSKTATDSKGKPSDMAIKPEDLKPLNESPDHWKSFLSDESYRVLFQHGTERAFTSPLNEEHRKGTFICAACNLPIFTSEMKFDSGTGWPSFTTSIPERLAFSTDNDIMYERTEYHCVRCGGHMGHVFDDGPRPTGQRWCNNGVSLIFIPEGEKLPALRS